MSDPRERLLEHALGRLLGGADDEAELAARIARAWERGERGSGLEGLDEAQPVAAPAGLAGPAAPAAPEAPAPETLPPRRWRRVAGVAAAVLATAGLLWLTRTPAAPVVARSATPVPLARGDDRLVRAGDHVRTPGGRSVELALEDGSALRVGPESSLVFAIDSAPELVQGSLRVTTGARAPAQLEAGFAALLAAPDTVLELALERGAPGRVLRLAVSRGAVDVTRAGVLQTLAAGDVRVLFEDAPPPEPLAPADEAWLVARCDQLFPSKGLLRYTSEWEVWGGDLVEFLRARPAGWAVFAAYADELFADERSTAMLRRGLLYLVAADDSPASLALARRLWRVRPDSFDLDVIVRLAERGAFEFQRELRAMAADPEVKGEDGLLVAAWLALDGDAEAQATLRDALDSSPLDLRDASALDPGWLAAAVLARGGDLVPWARLWAGLDADVERDLAAREERRAARRVLAAEFFGTRYDEPELSLGLLRMRWREHLTERSPVVQSAREIRAALQAL